MNQEHILTVLRRPHISEKATVMAEKFKQFIFKVAPTATKQEIKAAVEALFEVKVKKVSVLNVKGKRKRFKQVAGRRSDWKKAIVALHENYDINFNVTD